jgi:hypothetical protein
MFGFEIAANPMTCTRDIGLGVWESCGTLLGRNMILNLLRGDTHRQLGELIEIARATGHESSIGHPKTRRKRCGFQTETQSELRPGTIAIGLAGVILC